MECPQCTFLNHVDMQECEVCGLSLFALQRKKKQKSNSYYSTSTIRCHKCTFDNRLVATECSQCLISLDNGIDISFEVLPSPNLLFELHSILDSRLREGSQYHILSSPCPHISQVGSDGALWSCGYRNIQMLCFSLIYNSDEYAQRIFGGTCRVPDIFGIQRYIESMWTSGYDAEGSVQFGGNILGTSKWIGAGECCALMRYFGIRANVVEFISKAHPMYQQYIDARGTNDMLSASRSNDKVQDSVETMLSKVKDDRGDIKTKTKSLSSEETELAGRISSWVKAYFQRYASALRTASTAAPPSSSASESSVSSVSAASFSDGPRTCSVDQRSIALGHTVTMIPPIFLQHDGHSRTIIGVFFEETVSGSISDTEFLLYDPSHKSAALESHLRSGRTSAWQRMIKRTASSLVRGENAFQVVEIVPGFLDTPEEKQRSKTLDIMYQW